MQISDFFPRSAFPVCCLGMLIATALCASGCPEPAKMVTVPDLTGRNHADVPRIIAYAGLVPAGVAYSYSKNTPRYVVFDQRPAPGSLVPEGTPVAAVASLGAMLPTSWISVNIAPPAAETRGAAWRVDEGDWRQSGETVKVVGGVHTIDFMRVPGYVSPERFKVTLVHGQGEQFSATYTERNQIDVTEPNGEDRWPAGCTRPVVWAPPTGVSGPFSVGLCDSEGNRSPLATGLMVDAEGIGTCTVTLPPETPAGPGYTLQVTADDQSMGASEPFEIVPMPAVDLVTEGMDWVPTKPVSLEPTQTHCRFANTGTADSGPVRWHTEVDGHTTWRGLATNIAAGEEVDALAWLGTLAPGDHVVRLVVDGPDVVTETSEANNVLESLLSVSGSGLTITSPEYSVLSPGMTVDIRWKYASIPVNSVRIELLRNGRYAEMIAGTCPVGQDGNGVYAWTVSDACPAGSGYTVRVATFPAISAESVPFEISTAQTEGGLTCVRTWAPQFLDEPNTHADIAPTGELLAGRGYPYPGGGTIDRNGRLASIEDIEEGNARIAFIGYDGARYRYSYSSEFLRKYAPDGTLLVSYDGALPIPFGYGRYKICEAPDGTIYMLYDALRSESFDQNMVRIIHDPLSLIDVFSGVGTYLGRWAVSPDVTQMSVGMDGKIYLLAIDPDGFLRVEVYDTDRTLQSTWDKITRMEYAAYLDLDASLDECVYVRYCESGGATYLRKFRSDGTLLAEFDGVSTYAPTSLGVSRAGEAPIDFSDETRPYCAPWTDSHEAAPDLSAVTHIAVGPDDSVYGVFPGGLSIGQFDGDGKLLQRWGIDFPDYSLADYGVYLAMDYTGNCYVNSGFGRVLRYSRFGANPNLLGARTYELYAIGPDGSIYTFINDEWYYDLVKCTQQGELLAERRFGPDSVGLVVDTLGRVYVAGTDVVSVFDADLNPVTEWAYGSEEDGQPTSGGYALTIGPGGNLYMVCGTVPELRVYSPEGTLLHAYAKDALGPGGMHELSEIAVDSQGAIYIADRTRNQVRKFIPLSANP